jgi:hypothetical protein
MTENLAPPTRYQIAAWLMMAAGLLTVLYLRLLPALLAGLLVVQLVHLLAPRFVIGKLSHTWSKVLVVSLITLVVLGALGGATTGAILYLRTEGGLTGCSLKWLRSSKIAKCCRCGVEWLAAGLLSRSSRRSVEYSVHAQELRK